MPIVIENRVRNYALSEFDTNMEVYKTSVRNNQLDTARVQRNELIFKLKRHIDANYADFENNMFLGKASTNILFDTAELGAALAGTITNGERAKTIISGALTAFKGGRRSIDVNLFREKTTESLISTMRAARSRIEYKINIGLTNDVTGYTLEEALGDLINYFYAGSLSNALVELSQQSAEVAKEEKSKTDEAEKDRLKANFTDSSNINTIRNDLYFAFQNGTQADKDAARAKLLKALAKIKQDIPALKVSYTDTDSNDDLFKELQRILREAAAIDPIPTETILKALKN